MNPNHEFKNSQESLAKHSQKSLTNSRLSPNSFLKLITGSFSKSIALFLVLILAVSSLNLFTVELARAQTIPKPSVPEFTLKYMHSYYLKTITNSTTGTNHTQQYDNNTIVVTIKNQAYAFSNNGTTYQIFYDIRIKNHSAKQWQWTELYPIGTYYKKEFTSYLQEHLSSITNNTPIQSSSENTVVSLTYYNPPLDEGISFPIMFNTTLDLQVKAVVGHSSQGWVADNLHSPVLGGHYSTVTSLDTSSDWSSTQTIKIPAEPTNPSPTPTVPELSWLAILPIFAIIFSVAVALRQRKLPSRKVKKP
jgi:hypothetical protein